MKLHSLLVTGALALAALPGAASASLVEFKTFTGKVALSTDGFGSIGSVGTISASAPSGSTVLAAYIYTASNFGLGTPVGFTLNGTTLSYQTTVTNATACCELQSNRADVTSLVAGVINGGAGGVYDFNIDEGPSGGQIDGSALVVVYSNATLPDASVGILDGFASVTGDTTSITFKDPLDPTDPAFFAEMVLGINFSCCEQKSTVEVNGTLITENAGNYDDGELANGALITVGGFDDAFSSLLPSYEDDSERYDLTGYVTKGDKKIRIDTANASADDNIFLAAFYVSGEADFVVDPETVPVPASLLLLGPALLGLFGLRRAKKLA